MLEIETKHNKDEKLRFEFDSQHYSIKPSELLVILPRPPKIIMPLRPAGLLGILIWKKPFLLLEPGVLFLNKTPKIQEPSIKYGILLKSCDIALPATNIDIISVADKSHLELNMENIKAKLEQYGIFPIEDGDEKGCGQTG